MVVDMYIIGPKKDQFKPVFFGLFDFSKMKRPRPRLQKTNKWSFSILVLFGLSPVQLQSFASPRTGLSNTIHDSPTTGHAGYFRTKALLERDFWWPGLSLFVNTFISRCTVCQQNKVNYHPTHPPLSLIPSSSSCLSNSSRLTWSRIFLLLVDMTYWWSWLTMLQISSFLVCSSLSL